MYPGRTAHTTRFCKADALRRRVSGDVEVPLGDVAQEDVVGRLGRLGLEQALEPLAHLAASHEDAVALEDLPDELVVRLDGLRHRQVAVRAGAAARPEVERRHLEERQIRLAGL